MRTLGVIPARGGSKEIPGKNLQDLGGKPLVQWTIEAAQASQLNQIVLSSDDEAILTIAHDCGIEAYKRLPHLATDEIHAVDVVLDVLEQYDADIVMMLLPTSPFRTTRDINGALHMLTAPPQRGAWDALIGVTACKPAIRYRMITPEGYLKPLLKKGPMALTVNRQFCDTAYIVNGAMFATYVPWLRAARTFHYGKQCPFIMDELHGFDIDFSPDLARARAIVANGEHL